LQEGAQLIDDRRSLSHRACALGNDPGNRLATARDDDFLARDDLVDDGGEMRFRFGKRKSSHGLVLVTD
jgi:hypothetical protein